MSFLNEPVNTAPRELIPEGKHTGILYMVVDCGSVDDVYMGVPKVKHQVYLCWELPEAIMSDGRPFVYGNLYNVTDGQYGVYFPSNSNLNKMLRVWTGLDEKVCSKAGMLGKLLVDGTPCTISISHEQGKKDPTKTYAVAESIKPFKGKNVPERVNEPVIYALSDGEVPDNVPEWLKKKIASCLENTTGVPERKRQSPNAEGATTVQDDDIPF